MGKVPGDTHDPEQDEAGIDNGSMGTMQHPFQGHSCIFQQDCKSPSCTYYKVMTEEEEGTTTAWPACTSLTAPNRK